MLKYLAFDIGGTAVKTGLLDANATLLHHETMPTRAYEGAEVLIKRLLESIRRHQKDTPLEGIAISTAGVVNPHTGVVLHTTGAIKNYDMTPLKSIIEDATNLPCSVNNDVNCFALCEAHAGHAQDLDSFLTLTIGTGIGGAIIRERKLFYGAGYAAGEWGRMRIPEGIFEEHASISALVRDAIARCGRHDLNGEAIFRAADSGDAEMVAAVAAFYQALAHGIANLIYVFNPGTLVLGGGISARPMLREELWAALEKVVEPAFLADVDVRLAKHRNHSGMIGALYHFFSLDKNGQ